MSRAVFLYSSLSSFFIAVSLASVIDISTEVFLFVLLLTAALFVHWLQYRSHVVLLGVLVFVFATLGLGRFLYSDISINSARDNFEQIEEQETIRGVVVSEAIEKETTRQFTVVTDETRIVVTANRFPEVFYGDVVELVGEVQLPESFETDTGRVFDYPQYLAARGVTHQMFRPEINIVDSGEGNFITRNLLRFKGAFLARLHDVIPEPHVSLLGGLVVGAQEAMGEDLIEAFRITGLIHIVVLSGYNVTIVAESIMRVLGFLSRKWQAVFGVFGIVLFAVLTGASATIIRASIMALLVILARITGRTYDIVRALLVTAFVMVLYNPYILLFDPGFQLSFLATLGLIFLVPLLERLFGWVSGLATLKSFVLATIATQIFVLPLLLYQVGMLSTVSVIVNVLVLPVVPTVMFFGLLTSVTGFVATALSVPFGFVSYGLLAYILKIVEWFSALPFAAIGVPQIPAWLVILLYALYAGGIYFVFKRIKKV